MRFSAEFITRSSALGATRQLCGSLPLLEQRPWRVIQEQIDPLMKLRPEKLVRYNTSDQHFGQFLNRVDYAPRVGVGQYHRNTL